MDSVKPKTEAISGPGPRYAKKGLKATMTNMEFKKTAWMASPGGSFVSADNEEVPIVGPSGNL